MTIEHEIICKTKMGNSVRSTTPMVFKFGLLCLLTEYFTQTFHCQNKQIRGEWIALSNASCSSEEAMQCPI
jgi:hypothetical protein